MLILVVPFAFVQQINNNLNVLDILCLDHLYFAGVPQIILFSFIPHMSEPEQPGVLAHLGLGIRDGHKRLVLLLAPLPRLRVGLEGGVG